MSDIDLRDGVWLRYYVNLREDVDRYTKGWREGDPITFVGSVLPDPRTHMWPLEQAWAFFQAVESPYADNTILDREQAPSMSIGDIVTTSDPLMRAFTPVTLGWRELTAHERSTLNIVLRDCTVLELRQRMRAT